MMMMMLVATEKVLKTLGDNSIHQSCGERMAKTLIGRTKVLSKGWASTSKRTSLSARSLRRPQQPWSLQGENGQTAHRQDESFVQRVGFDRQEDVIIRQDLAEQLRSNGGGVAE